MSETTEAPPPGRRCHGSCGVPIPADNGTTSMVIGPDGVLRECCDGDGLGASWEGEVQARLAGLLARLRAQGPIRVRFG